MRTPPATRPDHRPDHTDPRTLRPLLGAAVTVRTVTGTWRGTLLSCVKGSAWLVVDDVDVMVQVDDIVAIEPDH
jgi:hypothetical protein